MGKGKANSGLPEGKELSKKEYEQLLQLLQIELVKLQNWVNKKGKRVIIIFEGRDAAGKGGTIQRILQYLNPRSANHVALPKPTERERTQWYFQRYVQHLPSAGEIVIFDRSWYNRAGVERVLGFCSDDEYELFMRTVPTFEAMLLRSGIVLIKYWLDVSKKEQRRRFAQRIDDPLKQWKFSPVDKISMNKWGGYTKAKTEMFLRSSTPESPWTVIKSDDKKAARINCIRDILSRFDYSDKERKVAGKPDPRIVGSAADPNFANT